jgi:hypothetical protein
MKMFARLFKFLVFDGQEANYATYLETVVAAIDALAHKDDVFVDLTTIRPDTVNDVWNHGRLFTFRTRQQREMFSDGMSQASLAFDGSEAARQARKAHAETMRRLVEISDYELS